MSTKGCCDLCYGRQGTSAGGGIFCADSSCKCHTQDWRYSEIDHYHCFSEKTTPPCGQRIEHYKCCLCEKLNPKIEKEISLAVEKEKERIVGVIEGMKKTREATHGNCCTCQKCGFSHDDCECARNDSLSDITNKLNS